MLSWKNIIWGILIGVFFSDIVRYKLFPPAKQTLNQTETQTESLNQINESQPDQQLNTDLNTDINNQGK